MKMDIPITPPNEPEPNLTTNERDSYTEEERDLADRTVYLMELYGTLNSLDRLGNNLRGETDAGLDFSQGDWGAIMFGLFSEVYGCLDNSRQSYGDDFRQINGTHLWEIQGIDASAIGINTVIPRELGKLVGGVSVNLYDLDQVRLNELQSVASMTGKDPKKVKIVQDIIGKMGGIKYDPLFKKKEENI